MVAAVGFESLGEDLSKKIHDFQASGDTLKAALTNTQPDAAADTVFADIPELAAGNGYTAGGEDVQNDTSRTGAVTSIAGTDVTWTATGSMGPFRYVVLYNDTPTSPADPLIAYWDYGSSITLAASEQFKFDIASSLLTVTVS